MQIALEINNEDDAPNSPKVMGSKAREHIYLYNLNCRMMKIPLYHKPFIILLKQNCFFMGLRCIELGEVLMQTWDILSNAGIALELSHIPSGPETGNCVSLLRVNRVNSSHNIMLILQESCLDPTASFVGFSPVDVHSMNAVLSGGNPDYVALLPAGFSILPDGLVSLQREEGGFEASSGGSLLTMGVQILVNSTPTEKLYVSSVTSVNTLVVCTVDRIKDAINRRRSNA